jgi:hypothetical protein
MHSIDPSFQLSYVSSPNPLPVPPVSALLAKISAGPAWDEASICRAGEQYPCLHLAWLAEAGFIVHCFEDAESFGDFLVEGGELGAPEIQVVLGGQAVERWPRQLFVSELLARDAVEFFLQVGKRTPLHNWVGAAGFPRETVWEVA